MHLVHGSWADAEALVGTVIAEQTGADPVNVPMVRQFLESLEWDSPVVTEGIAPFSMYMTFGMPAYWQPGDPPLPEHSIAPFPFGRVPAPGSAILATGTDVEFYQPMRAGDRIATTWRLTGITRKRLRLGDGAFMEFETVYRNQNQETVSIERTTVFRYEPDETEVRS